MRVDSEGNPHIVTSMVPVSANTGAGTNTEILLASENSGFYHFTIDRDYIDSPQTVNTPQGWNWSYIPFPAHKSFKWKRKDNNQNVWSDTVYSGKKR